jgi:PAS domain S-box-containing protein
MATPLNILIVEDSPDDEDLLLRELRREGFDPRWKRVETEGDFLAGIKTLPDIVLSDYSMPRFTGLRAAELLQQSGLNIPFILISGTVGEDVAVEAMKHGAADYLLKDRVARLGQAVRRALEQKRLRDEHQQVEKSSNLFRTLLDRSNDGIEVIDPQTGRLLDINTTTCQRLGYTREELLSMTVPDISVEASSASWAENIEKIRQSGFKIFESRHRRKDGSTFPVEINVRYVKLDRDYLIAAVRDITERNCADEKLRQSEAELAEGQRVAKLGNWRFDIASNQVRWSDELYRIFGVEPTAFHVTYENFMDCVLLNDRSRILKINADATANGGSFETEYRIQTRAGDLKTIREIGHTTKDAGGKVVALFGTAQDITEHKRAEDELHWKTALLEAQMDSALDGILVVNSQGKQILQNQRMRDLWKIPPPVPRNNNDAVQIDFYTNRLKNPVPFAAKVAHLNSHADEVSRDEIELLDGTILDRYSSPVRDQAGKYYGRIWTFRDITEQRKLEEQFRQSQKMEAIGQLAGGVAHDFNNILASTLMQVDLVAGEANLSDAVKEGLQQIRADAERAANLTRQLLLFSRRQVMRPRILDLNALITNLVKMLERIIGEQVQIRLHLHSTELMTRADAGMLDQVLMNLVVNARDAMPGGGQVRIGTTVKVVDADTAQLHAEAVPGNYVCFSVSDNGGGIPTEILPRIFEPFFTTKGEGKGTGLGLATAYGIVKQHQGWMQLVNRPGQGATFQIFLPASTAAAEAAVSETRFLSRRGTETILLVEDEAGLLKLARKILERQGYQVWTATNTQAALDCWHTHHATIALVLTDMVMPGGMSGMEMGRRMCADKPGLKVVFMSGYSTTFAGQEFQLRVGEAFVQKPFTAGQLLKTIRTSFEGAALT